MDDVISSPTRDKERRDELEKKVADQAEQIKKLAEVANKYKLVVRENNMFKSSMKPGSLAEEVQKLLSELQKKDELLKSSKAEAMSAINTLKARHQEQLDAVLKQKNSSLGSSNPSSLEGPTAHVAALTSEMQVLHERLDQETQELKRVQAQLEQAESRVKVAEEDAARARDEAAVDKEFREADLAKASEELAETKAALDALAKKEADLAAKMRVALRQVQDLTCEKDALQKREEAAMEEASRAQVASERLLQDVALLQDTNDSLKDQLDEALQQAELLREQLAVVEQERGKSSPEQDRLASADEELRLLRAERDGLILQLSEARRLGQSLEEQLIELRQSQGRELDEARRQCESLRRDLDQGAKQGAGVMLELETLRKQLAEMSVLEGGLAEARQGREGLAKELVESRQREEALCQKLETARQVEDSLREQLAESQQQGENLREQLSALDQERTRVVSESVNLKQQIVLKASSESSDVANKDGKSRPPDPIWLQEQNHNLHRELQGLKVRIGSLECENKCWEEKNRALANSLSQKEDNCQAVSELLEKANQTVQERDALLHEMNASLFAQQQDMQKIKNLQSSTEEENESLRKAMEQLQAVVSAASAAASERTPSEDKERLIEELSQVKAQLSASRHDAQQFKSQIKALEEQRTEAETEHGKTKESLATIKEQSHKLQLKFDQLLEQERKRYEELEQTFSAAEKDLQLARQTKDEADVRAISAETMVQSLESQIEELKGQVMAVNQQNSDVEMRVQSLEMELVCVRNELEVAQAASASSGARGPEEAEADKLRTELEESKKVISQCKEKLSLQKDVMKRAKAEKEQWEEERRRFSDEARAHEARAAEQARRISVLEAEKDQLDYKAQSLQEQLDAALRRVAALQRTLQGSAGGSAGSPGARGGLGEDGGRGDEPDRGMLGSSDEREAGDGDWDGAVGNREWSAGDGWQGVSAFSNPAGPHGDCQDGSGSVHGGEGSSVGNYVRHGHEEEDFRRALSTDSGATAGDVGRFRRHSESGMQLGEAGDLGPLQGWLSSIARLAGQAAEPGLGGRAPTAGLLQRLLCEVELLRPVVAAQLPPPSGETVEARSWEELGMLLWAGMGQDGTDGPAMVYCGVSDSANGLVGSGLAHNGKMSPEREGALLDGWMRGARGALGDGASALEWLMLAQRCGLPTRLVDFWHSPLAAAHMATLGAEDKAGVVWCVDARACHHACRPYQEWAADSSSWWQRPRRRAAVGGGWAGRRGGAAALSPEEVEDLLARAAASHPAAAAASQAAGGGDGGGGGGGLDLGALGDSVLFVEAAAQGGGAAGLGGGWSAGGEHLVAVATRGPERRLDDWLTAGGGAGGAGGGVGFRRVVIPAGLKAAVRARLDRAGVTERCVGASDRLAGLARWLRRTTP